MIQRIQSIYLLLAAILLLPMFMFPIATFGENILYACHIKNPENGQSIISMVVLALLLVFSTLLSFYSIFKYKNRKLQRKLGWFNISILITALLVEVIYVIRIQGILQTNSRPAFASIIPVVSIMLIILANRAIKKDDDLVKSADRLR